MKKNIYELFEHFSKEENKEDIFQFTRSDWKTHIITNSDLHFLTVDREYCITEILNSDEMFTIKAEKLDTIFDLSIKAFKRFEKCVKKYDLTFGEYDAFMDNYCSFFTLSELLEGFNEDTGKDISEIDIFNMDDVVQLEDDLYMVIDC